MVQQRNSSGETRDALLGPPSAVALLAAAAAILLVAGLALWQRHGLVIYVDMLATRIWNCL